MTDLIENIESLKTGDISKKVTERIKEFKQIDRESSDELFKELSYCILTARSPAEQCLKTWNNIKDDLLIDSTKEITTKLKQNNYTLASQRAKYISKAFKKKDQLKEAIQLHQGDDLRYWIIKNIDGIWYKEASHFLRNIGFDDFAIIDSHILTLLEKYDLIKKPENLTYKKYLEIEQILKGISQRLDITLAELDLYLWYMETGKILK